MGSRPVPPQPPLCLALVLSDAIWRDPGSQKRTILGTFSVVFAPKFPAQHGVMAVYCALTDGRGETEIKLSLVDSEEKYAPLAQASGKIDFSDPRAVVEIDLLLAGVVFPRPGEYRIQLFGADELLMERRLIVIHAPRQEGDGDDESEAENN